ncbi:MAG: hypothetical protein AB1813_16355, partial [Verrucomicrobiota bacterium]
ALTVGNGSRFGGFGSYTLSNGVVAVGSSTTLRALGTFAQWDGLHTITSNLVMRGTDLGSLGGIAFARYSLRDGALSAANLAMGIATFVQNGGINQISGDMVIGPSSQTGVFTNIYPSLYTLNGGFVSAANVILTGSRDSGFDQTGGTNVIWNELQITGQATNFHGYTMTGGGLSVSNISVRNGAAFQHDGGVINHSGLLTLTGGNWLARPGELTLGPLRLADGDVSSTSSIEFPAGASVLRLANSREVPWSSTATLLINNWRGSPSGGGETQLYFGSEVNALSHEQLAPSSSPSREPSIPPDAWPPVKWCRSCIGERVDARSWRPVPQFGPTEPGQPNAIRRQNHPVPCSWLTAEWRSPISSLLPVSTRSDGSRPD